MLIEECLVALPAVHEAAVICDNEVLIAFVVSTALADAPSDADIRHHLTGSLPPR